MMILRLLILYPILLLILTFYRARPAKNGGISPDYLSLEQAKMIRSSACVWIMLHHLTQHTTGYNTVWTIPVTILNNAGFLFTALFFFFSGFGLITSYYNRKDYLGTFLQNRLPSVLIPFWVVNALGICLNRFGFGIRSSAAGIFCDLFGLTLINSNGWFIIEIVILYLIFYFLFRLVRNKDTALFLLAFFAVLLILYSFFQGHDPAGRQVHWFRGEWWYNSTAAFIFGLLYARFREKTDLFFRKHHSVLFPVFCILFPILLFLSIYTVSCYGYYHTDHIFSGMLDAALTLTVQSITCLAFTILVLLWNMRIAIGNGILRFLSGISTELFLIHGYFINKIFAQVRMNAFIRFAAVIVCSIAASTVVSPAVKFLVRKVRAVPFPVLKRRRSYETLESRNADRIRNKRRKMLGAAIGTGIGIAACFLIWRAGLLHREYKEECRTIRQAGIGDEVRWGRYETNFSRPGRERLTWIVIRREGEQVCLLSREGISGSYYHQKHQPVTWEDSDLRALLQSEAFTDMFSRYEAADVLEKDGDVITLLTEEEALEVFDSDTDRQLSITSAAEANGTNINRLSKADLWDMKGYRSSWWWLKGKSGLKDIMAPVVTVNGTVSADEKTVNRPGGAVRPVIWIVPGGNS